MSDPANQNPTQLVAAGNALRVRGDALGAVRLYQAALAIDPGHFEACNNLGVILTLSGRLDEAAGLLERAVARQPNGAHAWANLGNALMQSGRVAEAVAACRRAVEIKPDFAGARSNLVFFLTFDPHASSETIHQEHRAWAAIHADPLLNAPIAHTNDRTPDRRLRIGYVSPDFRDHAVAYFVEGLLAEHDPNEVEVFCFSSVERPDAVTARLRGLSGQWQDIAGMDDDRAAIAIRSQRIDILVDLAGYTSGGRLLVFARKPAPIQVAYLGYPNTTGMAAMDYRIVDSYTDPPGMTEQLWTERLIRLPKSFACYHPPQSAGEVGPLPAAANGYVTFGSFAMLSKLNDPLIAAWSRIMQQVPGSRLYMAAAGLQEPAIIKRIQESFSVHGVEASRLDLAGNMKFVPYLATHRRIDVLLDSFPVNGHTISCHALWMGVPVVSLAGTSYRQRLGASLLSNVGLTDLLAGTTDEYIRIAVELAHDRPRLVSLRATLRQRMAGSSVCDAKQFTRDLESAYRSIWRSYCSR